MGIVEAIAGIADALTGLSGVDVILDAPPTALTQAKTVFLREQLGASTVDSHTSFSNSDRVYVHFHRLIAVDPSSVIADTRSLLDAMRAQLWDRYKNGRFGGNVIGLTAIESRGPMPMEYGSAVTFGFWLQLNITHGARIGA